VPIADNRLPLGGDAPPAAKAIVDLTNGSNQAVKETPEQIVAQLEGARHRASDWPDQ
jgi:hypothetical protein